jgi:hypothetical protein
MAAIDLTLPAGAQVASHASLLYTPDFWDPRKAYVTYEPDIEGATIEGLNYRRDNNHRSADELTQVGVSNIIMLTDLQHDFRDQGRLPVTGTNDVVLRACARILNGTIDDYYTGVVYSQDGHVPHHISYATRWRRPDGSPFDLRQNKAAILDLADRAKGIFRATCFDPTNGDPVDMGFIQSMFNIKDTVDYWDHLAATGQGPIWVFANHCKRGTDGVNLHPLLVETLAFMEGARLLAPLEVNKGHLRDTDWFGPLEPCRPDPSHPDGGFQKRIVDFFQTATGWVEFFGVAEDFCNFNMQRQTLAFFEGTQFFDQMAFATDGTAAIVPNAQHVRDLYNEAEGKGVKFFTHDAAFEYRA